MIRKNLSNSSDTRNLSNTILGLLHLNEGGNRSLKEGIYLFMKMFFVLSLRTDFAKERSKEFGKNMISWSSCSVKATAKSSFIFVWKNVK